MKKIICLLLFVCALFSTNTFAQKLTEQETKDLKKQNTLLNTKQKDEFAMFVLTQDTNYYHQAVLDLKKYQENLQNLIVNGYNDGSQTTKSLLTVYSSIKESNDLQITYLNTNIFKNKIVNDKEKCNKSVTYKEVEYKISKMRYEELERYLPEK